MVTKRENSIHVALPSSMVSEYTHLREKTEALGWIGRTAAIYRVDEIIIYPDNPDESMLIKYILGYMETPQYLRKDFYNKRPELRYAGALPPLRTKHHPLENNSSHLSVGDVREGLVSQLFEEAYLVDIGVDKDIKLIGKSPSTGTRVTVRVSSKDPLEGIRVKKSRLPDYWGYDLRGSKYRLGDLALSPEFDLTIATSRTGDNVTSVASDLNARWKESGHTLIAFGSHKEGIHEILAHEGKEIDETFTYTLNTIPKQGTETVRTEEALMSTLAILNSMSE